MHTTTAINHQTNHFKKFVNRLVERFQPLQLFCFAKTNLIAETNGCFTATESSYNCNYCLLMVTEKATRIDHEVQEFSNIYYHHGTISVISHSQQTVSEALRANSRFFIRIYTTGQLLYSRDGMSNFDFTDRFIPTLAAKKAQKHFDHHIPLAEGFLHGAAECLARKDFNVSTFMLHQVVEQCSIVLLRVHLAYRSDIHNLLRMLRLCCSFSDRPIQTFLSGSPEDERLFNLLLKSYCDSRYAGDFSVCANDAQILLDRVSLFLMLTKEMCIAKIEELAHQASVYQELMGENEVALKKVLH